MSTSCTVAARLIFSRRTCLNARSMNGMAVVLRTGQRTIADQTNSRLAPQAISNTTLQPIQSSNTASPSSDMSDSLHEPTTIQRRLSSSTQVIMMTEDADGVPNTSTSPSDNAGGDMIVDMVALQALASQSPTPLRLADMYKYAVETSDFDQRLRNAQYLYRELPIRMAQRAMDLLTLPHGLNESPAIRNVAHVYCRYLEQFQKLPVPKSAQDEQLFTETLERILLDRTSIPSMIANGIARWAADAAETKQDDCNMQDWHEMEDALYRFFTARVGLRFLTEHHILSSPSKRQPDQAEIVKGKEDFLGCIQLRCDPVHEVQKVAEQVAEHTRQQYGMSPEIQVVDSTSAEQKAAAFTYVPHHLQYMVAEVLKNSCRATVSHHKNSPGDMDLPPIKVVIAKGAEDVSIKIADQGGGAPRSTMEKIWNFAHSTKVSDESAVDAEKQVSEFSTRGFGLPLARIYARYFGGELTLRSMEGYGVDAYLYLPRLGHACEKLPASVVASPGEQDSNVVADMSKAVGDRPIVVSRANGTSSPDVEVEACTGVLDMIARRKKET